MDGFSSLYVGASVFCFALYAASGYGAGPDFNREVRPILAKHCLKCHGPDDGKREAGLRLDVREAALRAADSGKLPIVPGQPQRSELIRRIQAKDEDVRMPPPHTKDSLTATEQETLRQWIAAGAEYQSHWAFQQVVRPPLPTVKNTQWPRNPLDTFILARLEKEGLAPSPEADRYTLVRRVYLDLIGLPPTPAEADAFVRDAAPDAYERLVDRLLASPHYGERWARRWLDLVRYADTNGYEKDRPRSIWPYRDWLIAALNADVPFAQFTIEQFAGDMLPAATQAQHVATGMHRNTMLNEEGGIDPQEFRFYSLTDRVATTGAVWLGLTLGCAQCHTHKFDPLPHREYYQLMALLNNADEPEMDVIVPEIQTRRREIEQQIATLEAGLADRITPELTQEFDAWLAAESAKAIAWTTVRPASATSNSPQLTILDDNSVLSTGDLTKRDVYTLRFNSPLPNLRAIRLEAIADDRLPKRGPGRTYFEGPLGDFVLSELVVTVNGQPAKLTAATQSFANGKHDAATSIDGNPATGWSISGAQGRSHTAVFSFADSVANADNLQIQLIFEKHYPAALGRFRFAFTQATPPADAAQHPVEVQTLLTLSPEQRTVQQREQLLRYYLSTIAPDLKAQRKEIEELRKQLPAYPTTLVMQERPANNPRATFIRKRGEFLQPTEQVEPNTPSFLPALPAGVARDRLAFARWLVDPANPLTARVTVNRQWATLFGRGIVRTTEDFGYQGDPPTHPELLDWLAAEFAGSEEHGVRSAEFSAPLSLGGRGAGGEGDAWSLKRLHRLIVTSATYRQSSHVSQQLLAEDPENRLLARGPRFRLEAELIRDAVLQSCGLLTVKLGGPSVYPPQPPGITSEGAYGALAWNASPGEDRYRRSLYTFMKRTAPFAMFATFDAPSGESCVARREVSNTPLQALTLLNDAMFMEAAQALGTSAATLPGELEDRAAWIFRRVLTRPPQAQERTLLLEYFHAQHQRLEAKQLDAAKIAGRGDESDVLVRAAWTLTARALLNLDETITRE